MILLKQMVREEKSRLGSHKPVRMQVWFPGSDLVAPHPRASASSSDRLEAMVYMADG